MADIRHDTEVLTTVRRDRDLDAINVRIKNTGTADSINVVLHDLGRIPIGAIVIMSDKSTNVYNDTQKTEQKIDLKFTAANADVNLRIW